MRTSHVAATLAVATAIAAGSASAQDAAPRGALRKACSSDVQTVCAGVAPGGGRIKQCMQEKFDQLSNGCKSALQQAGMQPPGK